MATLPPISPELISAYQAEIAKSASNATAKRKAISLNRFFDWAKKEGHITENPLSPEVTSNPTIQKQKSKSKIGARTWATVGVTVSLVVLLFLLTFKLKLPIPFIKTPAQESVPESTIQTVINQQGGTQTPGSIPANSAGIGSWNLYAKLKLTDSEGSPRVGSQSLTFKVFNASSGGETLYTSQPQTITTDSNGSALISLADVPTSLFFQNNKLFLEPVLDSGQGSPLSARIPVETANTAANLGGFFPADPNIGAGPETVPVINSDGALVLASENPAIKAKEGNLLIEAQAVTIKAADGSGGGLEFNPDANGIAHFLFEGDKGNFLNAQGPNLRSGSLYYGMVPNNATGYDLIKLQSGAPKMTTKFSVDALGNTYVGGDLRVADDIFTGGVERLTDSGQLINITGYNQTSGNFVITQGAGDFASITKDLTTGGALNDVLTLTLDERGASNSTYSTLVLNRYDGAQEAMALLVENGNAQFNGQLRLGNFDSNPIAIGEGSLVYNTTDNLVYFWNGSAWVSTGSGGSASFSSITSGTNTTATMVVGSGASLSFTGTGTITASDVTCTSCVSNTELLNSSITFAGETGSTAIALGGTENITGGATITTAQSGSTLSVDVTDDSLDFAQFKDAMTLDANTDIALGALTLSTSGTGALNFASTGQVSFAGNVDATNGLDVTNANLTVGGANFSVDQSNGNITTAGDIAVNGGDITTTASTFNVANAATTLNLGSTNVTRTINIGTGTNADTINIGTGGTSADTITIGNTSAATTINLTKGASGNIVFTGYDCTGFTNGGKLTTDASGNVTCASDISTSGSGGSVAWSDITDPTANLALNMAAYTTAFSWTGTGAINPFSINFNNNAGSATTQNVFSITNSATTQTNDVNTESLLKLDNADTSGTGSTIVDNAILITNSGGITNGITDAIDASAAEIVNAINIGANVILGTTGDIDLNNFDVVGSTGNITTAGDIAVNGGDLTSTASTFNLLSTPTTINIGPSGASGSIALSGGSGDTGCTLDGTTGDFTCSGIITTTATSGTQGWWQRNLGVLSPANITDDLTIGGISTASATFHVFSATGNIVTSGDLAVNGSDITSTGALNLNATTTIELQDTTNVTGDFSVSGNTTLNGNTTLGDAITDTITFTGRVAQDSDLIPITATGTNTLGTLLLPWDEIYGLAIYQNGFLVCDSSGANCPAGSAQYWQLNSKVLSPVNTTYDVAVGGTATTSASFQAFGIETASGNVVRLTSDTITDGNVLYATASAITTGNILKLAEGGDQTFSGNVIFADIDQTGGGDGAFIGNFFQFLNAGQDKAHLDYAGTLALAGNAAVNGGTIQTSAATANLFNTVASTLNIGGAAGVISIGPAGAAGTRIDLAGGSGDTGCTVFDATGNFTCSGNIGTTATSGTQGWWQRNLGVLSPSNITDDLAIGGTATSSASFQAFGIESTTGNVAKLTSDTVTTGDVLSATASAITSGNIIKLGEAGPQNFTGNGIYMDFDNTGGGSFTGNFLKFDNATTTQFTVDASGGLEAGSAGATSVAYSRFGSATTDHGLSAAQDVLISGGLELNGILYLDGRIIANPSGTATIILPVDPVTTPAFLTASNWEVENTSNVGQAAFIVNQLKGTAASGDIFTASFSGTPQFTIHNDSSFTIKGTTTAPTNNTTAGTIYFDTDTVTGGLTGVTGPAGTGATTGSLFLRGEDSAWHRIAMDMTQYASSAANIANQSYIQIAHNQNTNDIVTSGWFFDTIDSLWKKITDWSTNIINNLDNQFNPSFAQKKKATTVALANTYLYGNGADGAVSISANTNINTGTSISGRSASCGDATIFQVTALTSTIATVSTDPTTNSCLVIGDEVLLMNMQGTNTGTNPNVGNWETLRVSSLTSTTVNFTTSKNKYYGDNLGDDTNIGTTANTTQRVILQRVPNYTNVTLSGTAAFTPSAWDGSKGGVMFFRASGTVTVATGTSINANGLGYAGGTSTTTVASNGESFDDSEGAGGASATTGTKGGGNGDAASRTAPTDVDTRGGGGGGGSDASATAGGPAGGAGAGYGGAGAGGGGGSITANNGGAGGTAGVTADNTGFSAGGGGGGSGTTASGGAGGNAANPATAGATGSGTNPGVGGAVGSGATTATGGGGSASTAGSGGAGGGGGIYGDSNLNQMFLGSGGGAGGADGTAGKAGGAGGGIVYIAAGTITDTSTGTVASNGAAGTAAASDLGAGGGGSGGSVRLIGDAVTLGTNLVSAKGGAGGAVATTAGGGGEGGVGRIAVSSATAISGSTSLPAFVTAAAPSGYYGVWVSKEINIPGATSISSFSWDQTLNTYGQVEVQTRTGATANSTDRSWESWKPATATTNIKTLDAMDATTGWSTTDGLTVADGGLARDVHYFEDEDIDAAATANKTLKFGSVGTNSGFSQKTITSTDLSNFNLISAWVYATQSGQVKLGFGEAASTEQEETIQVDAANTWQKVYWDISDVANGSKDAVTKVRVTVLTPNQTMYVDNIQSEDLLTSSPATVTSTANNYFQYRLILTTTNPQSVPSTTNFQLTYSDGTSHTIDASSIRSSNAVANVDGENSYYSSSHINVTESSFDSTKSLNVTKGATSVTQTGGFNPGTGADGAITVSSDTNINTTAIAGGRSCADAVNYSVTALTSTTATLESAPSSTCLAVGDEILLINLRGGNSTTANVGNYETLRISAISGQTVTFSTAKSKFYGDNSGDDSNIGLATSNQAVMLQRVPNYTNVTVSTANTDLTPSAWVQPTGAADANTETGAGSGEGGVMFFRATGTVSVGTSTTINTNSLGFLKGASTDSFGGDGGESFCGKGGTGASVGGGGAGGGANASGTSGGSGSCGGGGGKASGGTAGTGSASKGGAGGGGGYNTGGGGGGGYGTAGGGAANGGGDGGTNTSGDGGGTAPSGGGGGGTYGSSDLSTLFFGSAGGTGGADGSNTGDGGNGGGIIYVAANSITVSGNIQANGGAGSAPVGGRGGGGGGAGGSVLLAGNSLTLGSSIVTATGGATAGSGVGLSGAGGSGRIVTNYASSISGSTSPAASSTNTASGDYSMFISDEIHTPDATSYQRIKWLQDLQTYGLIEFQTRSGKSPNSTDGTWEAWKPASSSSADSSTTGVGCASPNCLSLQTANNATEWTTSNATLNDGQLTRNVDFFEDEDVTGAVNKNLKITTVGASNGYVESTPSANLSNYDYITAWVYATASGNLVKLGFGESAGTEQEKTFTINASNTWQKVYWDIHGIDTLSRDAITKLRVSVLSTNSTVYFDNITADRFLNNPDGSIITSTPNEYIQYRAILSTSNSGYHPVLYNVQIVWNNGFKVVQTDANTVRLYNYTGTTQQIRLDAIVFGADLAEWYTVDDPEIKPGDVVALTGRMDEYGVPILRRATGPQDPGIIGAISTKAGQTLGLEAENRRLLALAGRIPVNVDVNSDPIKTGDPLTAGSTPGTAQKAGFGQMVFARATSDWNTGGNSQVLAIVNNTTYSQGSIPVIDAALTWINGAWVSWDNSKEEAVTKTDAFASLIAANIKAGAIETQQLTANILIANQLKTNLITPLPDQTDVAVKIGSEATPSGKFAIQDSQGQEVAAIDNLGNATFSGELHANKIYADEIVGGNIESMKDDAALKKIQDLLTQVQADQNILNDVKNSTAIEGEIADLFVTNQAAINSLSVSTTLTVGSDLVFSSTLDQLTNQPINSLNSISAPLKLQSLAMAPIELMAGLVTVDTHGNVNIAGDLNVAGKITTPNLAAETVSTSNLIIGASEATESATIVAGDVETNSTVGKGIIPAGVSEITIRNPKVTDYSLVYITPTSGTQNYVLYVKSKENGKFVVGFTNPIDVDAAFNWWIVGTAN
jgi:hypothetical protein